MRLLMSTIVLKQALSTIDDLKNCELLTFDKKIAYFHGYFNY